MRRLWLSALLLQGCFYVSDDEYRARWDLDGDGVERPTDCDDSDAALQTGTWFVDADGDGFGGPEIVTGCEAPAGAVANSDDCDDASADVSPTAIERCNGQDDDCDEQIDEDIAVSTWFADADGDGFGDPGSAVDTCDPPAGHVQEGGDCDDTAEAVHPEAVEVPCNGVDDDCDEATDEDPPTWFPDGDGDGYGDADGAVETCDPPTGYVELAEDCDDDPDEHPGEIEVCDGKDNDCNGATDVDAIDADDWFEDCDGDGYGDPAAAISQCTDDPPFGACDLVSFATDCDDLDCRVNTAALEVCNGIDDNCDTMIDEGCSPDTGAVDTACPTGP